MKKAKHSGGEWGIALFVICALAFLMSLVTGGGQDSPKAPEPQTIAAGKFAIYDGDTLRWPGRAGEDPKAVKPLRLLQVNAPERGACLGEAATIRLAELVGTDGDLKVVYDPKLRSDRFDRTLAYLQDKDGRDVGIELVREGLAKAYFIGGERGQRADAIAKAQAQAQHDKRGIWGSCEPRAARRPGRE